MELEPLGDVDVVEMLSRRVHDAELRGEIELSARLIIAANESAGHLSLLEIDRLLDVRQALGPAEQPDLEQPRE